jgi:two-component system chemotaxis response regulator CheB
MFDSEHRQVQAAPAGLVVLAASFGGLSAIRTVLGALPDTFPLPVVVILHRGETSGDPLTGILRRGCRLPVQEGFDGARLAAGTVTVLLTGRRTALAADGTLRQRLAPGSRVSADAAMRDAACHYGASAIAVVLTGKLSDGAAGVQAVKRAGGIVIVQDPAECAAPGMPTAALATGCVDHRLPLAMIGPTLIALAMAPGAADLLRVPMAPWAKLEPAPTRP